MAMSEFGQLVFWHFTNGEVDQMEQDATDGYVADNVERLVTIVKVTGDSIT